MYVGVEIEEREYTRYREFDEEEGEGGGFLFRKIY